mmetsp:Transcript_12828/g.36887  ORF Transcript_12828/g.36887 Transcript_12828/m.36887 type:complete len:535 (-) Transcript_12828:233-1837(-)
MATMQFSDESQLFRGVLKSFSPRDGYGFISCPLLYDAFGRDVYIDRTRLPAGASAGFALEFTITISSRGQPQVQHAVIVDEFATDPADAAKALDPGLLMFTEGPTHFAIVLEKRRNNSRLGIDVDASQGQGLVIDSVAGGLVAEWNRRHPECKVKVGDCIVEVNGITGDAQEIFKECRSTWKLEMKLRRGRQDDGGRERSVLPTLSVVTWNILSSAYASFKMYPHVDPAVLRATRRRAQVSAALRQLNADVICLQEVDCPLEDLGLGENEFESCFAQRPGGRSDRCVIAWRRDRLEMGPGRHRVMLFDEHPPPKAFECDPAHYESGNVGLAVELRMKSDPGKRCVTVATTHLNWEPQKMDVRAWQAHIFFDMAQNLSGPRVVLCGDFNSIPGTQPHQFLAQGCGLASAYADVESSALTNSNADVCPGGFAAMIDYLWYSPKWFTIKRRLRLPAADELRSRTYGCGQGGGPAASEGGKGQHGGCSGGCDGASGSQQQLPVPTLLSESWPSDHLALAAVLELTNPSVDEVDWDFNN